ncbi:MAG: adenylyl-sulfate kinase [Chitinophagaceae bacterium]|nr:MAG: adenylyl-sulfate kinase [Chitinophagaceae bacterium]
MLQPADQFQAKIFWQSSRPLVAGRSYVLVTTAHSVLFNVTAIKYREQQQTGEHLSARKINANENALINISTTESIALADGEEFKVVDVQTAEILGQGQVEFVLHRSTNIRWQQLTIDKTARSALKQQKALCIWFTGLSGSGKSTIANLLEKRFFDQKLHTYLLDGDNLRHGLNRDLGFTEADRVENIRRVAEVARLMVDAGLIVIASFISPYNAERQMARKLFGDKEFVEIFVDTPLSECERRDVKGLYAKARRGELKNFTGIDSMYEIPESPELVLDTALMTPENCVQRIFEYLQSADLSL